SWLRFSGARTKIPSDGFSIRPSLDGWKIRPTFCVAGQRGARDSGGRGLGTLAGAGPHGAAEGDTPLVEVVRGNGHGDRIARQDADEVLADLAGNGGDDLVTVVQADGKLGVGQGLRDLALDRDGFLFGHEPASSFGKASLRAHAVMIPNWPRFRQKSQGVRALRGAGRRNFPRPRKKKGVARAP